MSVIQLSDYRKTTALSLDQRTLTEQEETSRWQKALLDLEVAIDGLFAYAMDLYGQNSLDEAWLEFTAWYEPKYRHDRVHRKLFRAWYLFSWKPCKGLAQASRGAPQNLTIAEVYLSKILASGTQDETDLQVSMIQNLKTSRLSFFRVKQVEFGKSLCLWDVFLDREVLVHDQWLSQRDCSGDLLMSVIGRVQDSVSGQSRWVFVGTSGLIPSSCDHDILEIREVMDLRQPISEKVIESFRGDLLDIHWSIFSNIEPPTRRR